MLKNMSIRAKLLLGFGSVLALIIMLTAVSISQVQEINERLHTINDVNSVKQRYAINFRGSVHDRAIFLRDVSLVDTKSELDHAIKTINKLKADYDASAEKMDEMFATLPDITAQEHEILGRIKQVEKDTLPQISTVIQHQLSGDAVGAKTLLMRDARPNFAKWLAVINEFIDLQESTNKAIGAEVQDITQQFFTLMLAVCGIAVLIAGILAAWIIRSIAPLKVLTNRMLLLANGDLSVDVPDNFNKDEVGAITGAVQVLKTNAIAAKKMEEETQIGQRDRLTRSEKVTEAVRVFESSIERIINQLTASSGAMMVTCTQLTGAVNETTSLSASVAAASHEASTNVQTVAAAAEELSASIQEIAKNVADTAESTKSCAQAAQLSQSKLVVLQRAVEEIDSVILSINSVAEQTNLLALNATIEAARAGEAGKGFAVVASEVKTLASETHKMTEEIARKVSDIKTSAGETITTVNSILSQIEAVDEKTDSVASAVEEQNSSTLEISRNVQQASLGTDEVSRNIERVQQAANDSSLATGQMQDAFTNLNRQAEELSTAVAEFLKEVRAA